MWCSRKYIKNIYRTRKLFQLLYILIFLLFLLSMFIRVISFLMDVLPGFIVFNAQSTKVYFPWWLHQLHQDDQVDPVDCSVQEWLQCCSAADTGYTHPHSFLWVHCNDHKHRIMSILIMSILIMSVFHEKQMGQREDDYPRRLLVN